ncbi:MAG TPA: hypothetical protein VLD17_03365 [Gemmatimonadaceae bacterium]|jgi:hypothetical protein|nr:hypothetical protein [Gemmatimonadaceae bacterium]
MPAAHNAVREGVVAGVIAATGVAVWFLVVDVVSGHGVFYTPELLGAALFSVFGNTVADSTVLHIAVYTVFHYAAFVFCGLVASRVVHRAEVEPSVLVTFTLLFIIFELGFYGVAATMAETRMHALAWYQIAAGNVLAAVLMGTYLYRTHPALRQEFEHAMEGE